MSDLLVTPTRHGARSIECEVSMMQRCTLCKGRTLRPVQVATGRTIVGHTFTVTVTAAECVECGKVCDEFAQARVDLQVASALANAGECSGEALKFMRKALGYSGRELGRLLGVTVESVSRWETGKHAVEPHTIATLAALADDRLAGRTVTYDRLVALRELRSATRPQHSEHAVAI